MQSNLFKSTKMAAAADFLGPGAIEVNMYEDEIFDVVRRTSLTLNRIPTMKATGHPHRYFEQTAISEAAFTDPRNIIPTASNPTRIENTAFIKAIVNQTNLSMFDKEVTEQQGQFSSVVAKDIMDIINGIEVTRAIALWTGNDTSMSSPTSVQYFGFLTQITQTATIASGSSIVDGIKAMVATMFANQQFVVRPSAIYMNPIAANYLDQEAKAAQVTFGSSQVTAGVTVKTIATQVGDLPMIPDPYLPATNQAMFGFSAPPDGFNNYFIAILSEKDCEIPYISGADDNPNPRLFQLGLLGNLAGQYVGIKFDCVIAKGASYNHAIICLVRP